MENQESLNTLVLRLDIQSFEKVQRCLTHLELQQSAGAGYAIMHIKVLERLASKMLRLAP